MIKKPKDPILIVEDDPTISAILQDCCDKLNVEYLTAANGREALELLDKQNFSVYSIDLIMPVLDGKSLIAELKKRVPDSHIIVTTGVDNPDTIIEVMKMDVFDYMLKPINPKTFKTKMTKALEVQYLKEHQKEMEKSSERKLRGQLDWLIYKEKIRTKSEDSQEKNVIYNLQSSLTSGGGFGTMVTILSMIESRVKDLGETYEVPKNLMDLLFQNNAFSSKLLSGLNMIVDISNQDFSFDLISSTSLVNKIPDMIMEIEDDLKNHGFSITYPVSKQNCNLKVNLEMLKLCLEEMLINAAKYGVEKSIINIFAHISEGYFVISVKNDATEKNPLDKEAEKLVLEPFFRAAPPTENLESEKIGLGLGLTMINHILKKHNGICSIQKMDDFLDLTCKKCTITSIFLPISL